MAGLESKKRGSQGVRNKEETLLIVESELNSVWPSGKISHMA